MTVVHYIHLVSEADYSSCHKGHSEAISVNEAKIIGGVPNLSCYNIHTRFPHLRSFIFLKTDTLQQSTVKVKSLWYTLCAVTLLSAALSNVTYSFYEMFKEKFDNKCPRVVATKDIKGAHWVDAANFVVSLNKTITCQYFQLVSLLIYHFLLLWKIREIVLFLWTGSAYS